MGQTRDKERIGNWLMLFHKLLIIKSLGGSMRVNKLDVEDRYEYADFLTDMRKGDLKDNFELSNAAWAVLISNVNVDVELAKEILDNYILTLLKAKDKYEMQGVFELAEICVAEQKVKE
jgi:hypothetical protein